MTTRYPSRAGRRGGVAAGLLALAFPLAACGDDGSAAGSEPSNISLAPSASAPPASPTTASTVDPATPSISDPSTAQSEDNLDASAVVAAAESAVADGAVVEISQNEDDAALEWEVTVRVGDAGRELRIAGDGSVLRNAAEPLSAAQRGSLPKVDATEAISIAEKLVGDGGVTDAELSQENGVRVWDIAVDVPGGTEWELWIDAASGQILRQEQD